MKRLWFSKRALPSSISGEHEPDRSLVTAVFVLIVFGLVMLFSASSAVSYARYGNTYHFLSAQFINLAVGLVAFFIGARVSYRWWRKFALPLLFASVILLSLVFIPGLRVSYGSAYSWISLFGHSFQPAEFVKIFFLIYLATWLEAKKDKLHSFASGSLPFFVILAIISLLMIAQPDWGTLFIIGVTALAVFFIGGGKFSHIFLVVLAVSLGLFLLFTLKPSYPSERFQCLENPSANASGKCYQVNQALIAVGSGGWFGRGLGASRQKYFYLPEVWGDSIFPVIAEETGFIVSSLLIFLYLFIFYRGLLIARDAPDIYGRVLAAGIVIWLALQTFLNIGGMINLIPITGVPLPFISAGGSAIFAGLFAIGILVNISRQTKTPRKLKHRSR